MSSLPSSIRTLGRIAVLLGLGSAGLGGAALSAAEADEAPPPYTMEQRIACTPDAFRLCFNEIPDVVRVRACMRANKASLSDRCRATFRS